MANLRRDSARRSYRSMVTNRFVSSERTVANLAGPSGVLFRYFSMKAGTGISVSLRVRSCLMTLNFPRCLLRFIIVRVSPTHCKGVDGAHNARGANRSALRRRGVRVLGFRRWPLARQFRGQALQPLRIAQDWKRRAGSARGEAVSRRARATGGGFRATAGPRVLTIGPDFARADHELDTARG